VTFFFHADGGGEDGEAVEEIRGSVEGIDDPPVFIGRIARTAFFGKDCMSGEMASDDPYNDFFRPPVNFRDQVADFPFFCLNISHSSYTLLQKPPCFSGCFNCNFKEIGHCLPWHCFCNLMKDTKNPERILPKPS
jgi:hypothetical protein